MKIKNFIPAGRLYNGLQMKEMRGLKQVVALFGKNGAGKSRLLSLLESETRNKLNPARNLKTQIEDFESKKKSGIGLSKEEEKTYEEVLKKWENICLDIDFEFEEQIIKISPLKYGIESPDMVDSEYRSHTQHLLTNPRYDEIKPNALRLIKSFCKSEISQEYYRNHSDKKKFYRYHDELGSQNIKTLKLIRELIKRIMKKDLDYATDEHLIPILLLNKRPIEAGELSLGERDLLAYCVYIAVQTRDQILNKTVSLKGKTLIIDEPDLFLHPEAQIDLINGLKKLVGENGQIWIATHSLTILSILQRDEIWLVENGDVISPSIETPNKILNSIVGEENIDNLESFLSSQYEWGAIQFALECLFPPTVSEHKKNDPQQDQIIQRLSMPTKPVKILDFGAGQGRIAQEILRNEKIAEKIYYQALEETKELHERLEDLTQKLQQISKVDPTKEREVLDSYEKLTESQYKNYFDYVLLINVLHELEVNKWSVILNAILGSLKKDGKIIILEDQAIPRGENAHEYGFIILNVEELKILFSLSNKPKDFKHKDPKYADRLMCIEVPKSGIKITNKIIVQAFERKKTNCKIAINRLKKKTRKTPTDGRKNSFLTQLYANVDMAIPELEGKK